MEDAKPQSEKQLNLMLWSAIILTVARMENTMKYQAIYLLLTLLFITSCAQPQNGAEERQAEPQSTVQAMLPLVKKAGDSTSPVTVYSNGAIYTVNPAQPWATTVAIQDEQIIAVGTEAEVLAKVGNNPTIIDLQGQMMLPGFQDPHLHVLEAGLNENLCYVSDDAEFSQYIREVRACAAQQTDRAWVQASGANMASLLYRDRSPLAVLDEAVPDRPVIVLDDLGHGAWLNTLAMQAVGYDSLTSDPPGGIILIDPDYDDLTGIVLENAQQKARTAANPPDSANLEAAYQGLLLAMDILAQNGVTSVSDAGGYWTRGHETVWQRANDENTLTVRASNALYVYPDQPFESQITELTNRYSNDSQQLLRFNQAKIYVDGILSQGTGALLAPYDTSFELPNVPDDGFLYFDEATLNNYAQTLSQAGFQLHFHITGDRATRLALDAIEAVNDNQPDPRHRITHLYLVDAADRPRFSQLGVVADFQLAPSSVSSDYKNYMTPYLGSRAEQLLPAFDLLNQGATVTLSSDWDADELSPFKKISSVLGQSDSNKPDLATVIRMMTLDVAYLLHQEQTTGSIEVGKWADLIVINQNLFEVNPSAIKQTKVQLTLLGGEEIYRAGQ
ncbi:amidohydrolase [Anaerolineales bacterium HSG6]|nr:amidohydrolase [Anaerolineales bacterium HSG6]